MEQLAVVACYFSPCGYSSPRRNLDRFCQYISQFPVKFYLVELAFFDRPFELPQATLQVRGDSIMFQKERLWNLGGEQAVAAGHDKIVFFDADIEFEDPAWPKILSEMLDRYSVVQCFHEAKMLYTNMTRQLPASMKTFFNDPGNNSLAGSPGLAWGMTSEVFKQVQFFDTAVIGSGDTIMASSCMLPYIGPARWLNWVEMVERHYLASNTSGRCHYIEWAAKFARVVGQRAAYAPTTIVSMPHGPFEGRRYRGRHTLIDGIDASKDVIVEPGKALEWSEQGKRYAPALKKYFEGRKEDDEFVIKWF